MKRRQVVKCPKCNSKLKFRVKRDYVKYQALLTIQCTECNYYDYLDILKEGMPEFNVNKGKKIFHDKNNTISVAGKKQRQPTLNAICPRCKNNTAFLCRIKRGSVEGEPSTIFLECTNCDYEFNVK